MTELGLPSPAGPITRTVGTWAVRMGSADTAGAVDRAAATGVMDVGAKDGADTNTRNSGRGMHTQTSWSTTNGWPTRGTTGGSGAVISQSRLEYNALSSCTARRRGPFTW